MRFAVVSDGEIAIAALLAWSFQSALRFAVVSDYPDGSLKYDSTLVSIRFEVRGGFRLSGGGLYGAASEVSIRFEVRGGFRRSQQLRPFWQSRFNPL